MTEPYIAELSASVAVIVGIFMPGGNGERNNISMRSLSHCRICYGLCCFFSREGARKRTQSKGCCSGIRGKSGLRKGSRPVGMQYSKRLTGLLSGPFL